MDEALITQLRLALDNDQAPVDAQWVDQMMQRYPYFDVPLLLYLKRNPSAPGREQRLARLAITFADRRTLALQLGEGMEAFAHFYPDEPEPVTPDTDTTIDRFLSSYGSSSPKEIAALESAIFNPMPDYADVLAAQEREQGGSKQPAATSEQDERINRFIEQSIQQEKQASAAATQHHIDEKEKQEIADAPVHQAENADPTDDSMLSESLAKMYIARQKYSQALEIIENISLNFPEKSIYFADQIRFLRKLVWLENKQKTNNNN